MNQKSTEEDKLEDNNNNKEENLESGHSSGEGHNPETNHGNSDPLTNGLEGDSEMKEGSQASAEEKELTEEEKIQQEIQNLRKDVETYKDSWQRERAEFINYRKRTAQELLNSRKEAVRNFIHDLLMPMDNMDMVTNVKQEELQENPKLKAFVDGVVMVKNSLLGVMDKEGVKRMEPLNQPFDPMTMEAISSEESDEFKEETVIEVYQPGYYFQDGENKHSIRPARVKVGKPK